MDSRVTRNLDDSKQGKTSLKRPTAEAAAKAADGRVSVLTNELHVGIWDDGLPWIILPAPRELCIIYLRFAIWTAPGSGHWCAELSNAFHAGGRPASIERSHLHFPQKDRLDLCVVSLRTHVRGGMWTSCRAPGLSSAEEAQRCRRSQRTITGDLTVSDFLFREKMEKI